MEVPEDGAAPPSVMGETMACFAPSGEISIGGLLTFLRWFEAGIAGESLLDCIPFLETLRATDMSTYRARVQNGMIVFNGNLPLPDGTEVTIVPDVAAIPVAPTPANGTSIDPVYRLGDDAVDAGVSDFADEHDHYIYGTPKRGEQPKG